MKSRLAVILLSLVVAGCATKPVRTTKVHRTGLEASRYDAYVARRTEALHKMGGVFSDRDKAAAKATEEATNLYGEPPAEVRTSWSWGSGAGREEAQSELVDNLEQMNRDQQREK